MLQYNIENNNMIPAKNIGISSYIIYNIYLIILNIYLKFREISGGALKGSCSAFTEKHAK